MPLPAFDPLELYSGMVGGPRRSPLPPAAVAAGADPPRPPREVFDAIVLDALRHPPCHVLFSGGKDSSVVLAGAVRLAREHGTEAPIALTTRYAKHPLTHENEWQERVIGHLGVQDWIRSEVGDELDLLGDISTQTLRRFGPYWPANAHSMVLFGRLAKIGTLVSGVGGDEIFDRWAGRRGSVRESLERRPRGHAAKWAAFSALPAPIRHRVRPTSFKVTIPWLQPAAQQELNERLEAGIPLFPSWRRALADFANSRYYELARGVIETFVDDAGPHLVDPFMDRRMVRAVAAAGPRNGYESRGQALSAHFSDLLPLDILSRTSKAVFTETNWGPRARAFVAAWDGSGLDERLVDADRLREVWSRETPDGRSLACLQMAWLATQ